MWPSNTEWLRKAGFCMKDCCISAIGSWVRNAYFSTVVKAAIKSSVNTSSERERGHESRPNKRHLRHVPTGSISTAVRRSPQRQRHRKPEPTFAGPTRAPNNTPPPKAPLFPGSPLPRLAIPLPRSSRKRAMTTGRRRVSMLTPVL